MANRRFEVYEYRQVLHRMRLGDSDREIARLGLMGRARSKELRAHAESQGWLATDRALPEDEVLAAALRPRRRRSSVSSLERYREQVVNWRRAGLQGTTIHAALVRMLGFSGSYSSVRRFLRGLEPSSAKATSPMVFEPGEAAQVDFGRGPSVPYGGAELLTWAFVMTLCWSRHQYVELVRDQSVETWLGCHQRAFEFFGGVPARVIVDNAKCAITRACFHDPTVQRSYAELAEGYDFRIDPCPPRAPEKKGRVESGIKFFKQSFVPLREFRDLEDANRQAREWVLGEAGQRIHGSTRERPLTRFLELERGLLRPLPLRRVEPCSWARVKVARDCHVRFEHAYYSVPYRLIGHTLWLAAGSTLVRIYDDSELVASHVRSRPGEWRTVEDHLPPEAVAYLRRSPQWCRERAQEIGPHCAELVHRLQGDQVLERHRAVQGIVRLAERYGAKRLEAACERALRFSSLQYRSVKTILEQGLDAELEDKTAVVLGEAYQGQGRFHRDTRTLLAH